MRLGYQRRFYSEVREKYGFSLFIFNCECSSSENQRLILKQEEEYVSQAPIERNKKLEK